MKLFTVAGELSGDAHGGALLAGLRARLPGLEISGIGGPAMNAAGLKSIYPLSALQVHGLLEVVAHLPRLYRMLWHLERTLERDRPDAVLLIDYPGFNLKLAAAAKRRGIPVFYYSSPQVWAWRKGRLDTIASTVALMIVLFPFEETLYRDVGMEAHFLGHPLAGQSAPPAQVEELRAMVAAPAGTPVVALMPGSRPSELRRHLDVMLEAMRLCEADGFRGRYVIPVAPNLPVGEVRSRVEASGLPALAVEGAFLPLLGLADLAITASGTATLQTALAGVPFLVVYKVSPLTFFLARRFAYLPHISMVNILAGREVVPEILQKRFTPAGLSGEFLRLARDDARQQAMRGELKALAASLGEPGAYDRAAALLASRLQAVAGSSILPIGPGGP